MAEESAPEELPPIPNVLNVVLCLGLFLGYLVVLGCSAGDRSIVSLLALAALFALLMIPVYSLLHEAFHEILHRDRRVNYALGLVLSLMFMAPFTFLQRCHWGHHRRNRSDYELFDLYYPGESRAKKTAFLIFLRVGFYWLALPVSCFIFVFAPSIFTGDLLRRFKSIDAMTRELQSGVPVRMRLESLGVLVFHTLLFVSLPLQLKPYLLLYSAHAFIWSSHDYVNHAFAVRDVLNGAYNHRLPMVLQRCLFLNFNLHLAHHQHPLLPWNALESAVAPGSMETTYLGTWIELWKGPRMTTEPSPEPVDGFFVDDTV